MNILLGMTGSVAVKLAPKLIKALDELGTVKIVVTPSAEKMWMKASHVWSMLDDELLQGREVLCDADEWNTWQKDGDPILHIDLRKWADVLVVAPITANTLSKFSLGIADNLLTNVFYAWDKSKPVILAPAMNTLMWENPNTGASLSKLTWKNITIVRPIEKKLACGDTGIGAMANIDDIAAMV